MNTDLGGGFSGHLGLPHMSFHLRDLFQSWGLWLLLIVSHKRVATSLRPTGTIQGVQGCWATGWHLSSGRKEREEKEGDRGLFLDNSSDLRILEIWVLLLTQKVPRICWRRENTPTEAPICFPFWNSGPKMSQPRLQTPEEWQPTTASAHEQHTNYTFWERVGISEPFVSKEWPHSLFSSTTLAIFLLTFLCPGRDITLQVLSYDPPSPEHLGVSYFLNQASIYHIKIRNLSI